MFREKHLDIGSNAQPHRNVRDSRIACQFEKQLAKRRKRNLEEIRKVEMKWAYKGFKSWQETGITRVGVRGKKSS